MKKFCTLCLVLCCLTVHTQTVTDFDGNVYDEIVIGDQTWLQQNLKSLHYSDGTPIPDVLGYENNDSLVEIYGRLYTWDAAMRGSTTPMVQGVCPEGWHLASTEEWIVLEDYLGGFQIAGGVMKATGNDYWNPPNTGATNSSGFTALAGGEYDTPNGVFQFLMKYAVFWTSTQVSTTKARERFLSYNSEACDIYDWHKSLNYSIRCVKDQSAGTGQVPDPVIRTYPNPATREFTLSIPGMKEHGVVSIFNTLGQRVLFEPARDLENHTINVGGFDAGIYTLKVEFGSKVYQYKILKTNL